MPATTAAAEPPLEPPAVRSGSQGLFVVPVSVLCVTPSPPKSGVVVLPIRIAPAAFIRDQASESLSATFSAWLIDP